MVVEFDGYRWSILRSVEDFGFESHDLVSLPTRIRHSDLASPLVNQNIDKRRVKLLPTPASIMSQQGIGADENWLSMSSRTLGRLFASFLICEDPQRRLDARKAATLMHQVSLIQHILGRPDLKKVLIGDEVGLGKTIEAGLLMRQLIDQNPNLRILYLAPARLVKNVVKEMQEKLDIDARKWVAGNLSDARLEHDRVVIASINKAAYRDNLDKVAKSGPWDVLIVDECHHLSDWDPSGGSPNQSYKLVSQIVKAQRPDSRLILLSGTPHQGSEARFLNILRLLSDDGKTVESARGRVIYRTKDRVRDWRGAPLFPTREIRKPIVVELGAQYKDWYSSIGALYDGGSANSRAAGWAKGLALQWAASSVQAGLGFLVRLGMRRLGWNLSEPTMVEALSALRPYRGGPKNEPLPSLFERISRQIGTFSLDEDDDDEVYDLEQWIPEADALRELLQSGVRLIESGAAREKWKAVCDLIDQAGDEKVVLFAQPVETVTIVAEILKERYGHQPAIIIGNQSDEERTSEVDRFQSPTGTRFLVSSRAGGEGLNMQKARRLIHLDVPWNPMDMEQRIGRIHRFGSRKTVLIDTVVAAGSREIDMYRIAREKLALIAKHLDPEQFETLFSRVMSLVPPKELENILADISSSAVLDSRASSEIGRLVTEGYKSWSSFDQVYRKQADEIRAVNPGQANWNDVGNFLLKYGNADDGKLAHFDSFQFQGEEIVAVDEQVPTISFKRQTYACGDTGGMIASDTEGKPALQLGLNLPEVQEVLRAYFDPDRPTGLGFVKRPANVDFLGDPSQVVRLFCFVRQTLRQERGIWLEEGIALHIYSVDESGAPIELDALQRASLVRLMHNVPRVKEPNSSHFWERSKEAEANLIQSLRRPSDDQISTGIRFAVWPIAILTLVP